MTAVKMTARRPPFRSVVGLPIMKYVAIVRYDYVACWTGKRLMCGAKRGRQERPSIGRILHVRLRERILNIHPLNFALGLQESNAKGPHTPDG